MATGGDDVRTWLRHAQAQWRTGRRDEAQMTLRQALRRFGDQAELHNQMGLFLAAQGRLAQAREASPRPSRPTAPAPRRTSTWAWPRRRLNDVQAALRSFQRAYELRPSDMVLAHRLALAAKAADQRRDRS